MSQRKLKVSVLSDLHLGTLGCRAEEILHYLKSIKPEILVLNGDIVDMWQFKKKYWPAAHTKVIREILKMSSNGTMVYYLPGNHDEELRRFVGFEMGSLIIDNKLVLTLNGKKVWIFHGDVFDVTMQYSPWLTRLGSVGYDFLIWLNYKVNKYLAWFGKEKISFSKKIKNGVKGAVKYINKFEDVCAEVAIQKNYDYVICGHIHAPCIREIKSDKGKVIYMNSGDWIENLSALEYKGKKWSLYHYRADEFINTVKEDDKNAKVLFQEMLSEFKNFE